MVAWAIVIVIGIAIYQNVTKSPGLFYQPPGVTLPTAPAGYTNTVNAVTGAIDQVPTTSLPPNFLQGPYPGNQDPSPQGGLTGQGSGWHFVSTQAAPPSTVGVKQ